jgi:hypothetical protein
MQSSRAPGGIATRQSKRCNVTSRGTARRPRRSWPTRCASFSPVRPLSSIMPYGGIPCRIPPSHTPHPQRSSCPASKWPRSSNSTRIAAASTCPVPAQSQRSYTASPPCCLQGLFPRGTRPDASTLTAALDRCRSPAPRPRHHHVCRRGPIGSIETPLGGEVRAFCGADTPSPR